MFFFKMVSRPLKKNLYVSSLLMIDSRTAEHEHEHVNFNVNCISNWTTWRCIIFRYDYVSSHSLLNKKKTGLIWEILYLFIMGSAWQKGKSFCVKIFFIELLFLCYFLIPALFFLAKVAENSPQFLLTVLNLILVLLKVFNFWRTTCNS